MKKAALVMTFLLGLAAPPRAGAITLEIGGGVNTNPTSSAATCRSPLYGNFTDCTTTAFISDDIAGPNNTFMNLESFGSNSSLGEESFATALTSSWPDYKLDYDPDGLADITLTVTSFNAFSNTNVGGISSVTVSMTGDLGADDPTLSQLMWIQGLEVNYQPGLPGNESFNTATTFNVMDTSEFDGLGSCQDTTQSGTGAPDTVNANTGSKGLLQGSLAYCGPIYPYQYGNNQFGDAPSAGWPNGSFRGTALLGTIDTQDDTITVYGGVSYGFDNSVAPEPGTWGLLLAGTGLLLIAARRKARDM